MATTLAAGVDPVCGMEVDATSEHRLDWNGNVVHFCSAGCREKFAAHPERYSGDAKRRRLRRLPWTRSTPARCIRKSGRKAR